MFSAIETRELVPFDGSFRVADAPTAPPRGNRGKKQNKARLEASTEELDELQRVLYADDQHAILLIFQAMDAAGKDSTIRAVMTGVNPMGCQVFSFKKPSHSELDHDFLWRTSMRLPERGRIGIFNRSYYEEVLVVRVHPQILAGQKLPDRIQPRRIWKERFESICELEKHLARNGTVIVKFWLNVSKEVQRQRFLDRIRVPKKNWKFSTADVRERQYWDEYMHAYQGALRNTSKLWAPWYAIPADDKPYMRWRVSDIVVETLKGLKLKYPQVGKDRRNEFKKMEAMLQDDQPTTAGTQEVEQRREQLPS